mgnify:CR=1 FL=1
MDSGSRRITNTWLIDDSGVANKGDFLLNQDGTFSSSSGDEDVVETIDGSKRLVTRSLQNWHTHLAMVLNKSMGEGLPLMEWLETSIFPVEKRLTEKFVEHGTRAAIAEMIATGTTFACDMYHFPESVVSALNEAGLRGIVCGPQTQWPPQEGGDDGSVRRELDLLLASNRSENKVNYGVATHAIYTCDENTLLGGKELAEKHDAYLSIHVSETRKEVADCFSKTGMYPVEYLDDIDYFIPEKTIGMNNYLYSFKGGKLYRHLSLIHI